MVFNLSIVETLALLVFICKPIVEVFAANETCSTGIICESGCCGWGNSTHCCGDGGFSTVTGGIIAGCVMGGILLILVLYCCKSKFCPQWRWNAWSLWGMDGNRGGQVIRQAPAPAQEPLYPQLDQGQQYGSGQPGYKTQ